MTKEPHISGMPCSRSLMKYNNTERNNKKENWPWWTLHISVKKNLFFFFFLVSFRDKHGSLSILFTKTRREKEEEENIQKKRMKKDWNFWPNHDRNC